MSIEKVGPGGVGNSYGTRATSTPTKIGQAGGPVPVYSGFEQFPATAGFRFAGGLGTDWQPVSGSMAVTSANGGELAAIDPTVLIEGLPAMKLTFSASGGTYIARYTLTNPVSFAQFKTIQVPFLITGNDTNSGLSIIQVWALFSDGSSARLQIGLGDIPPLKWNNTSMSRFSTPVSPGGITFSGATMSTFDTLTITSFQFVIATSAGSVNYPVWVGPIRSTGNSVGRISLVFDGEYISQYTLMKPILDQYGINASLAITTADIGVTGNMSVAQIDEMYKQGYECIHHTFDSTKTGGYVNATQWPTSVSITNDINNQWNFFRSNGWTRGIGMAVVGFVSMFTGSASTSARQRLIIDALKAGGVRSLRSSAGVDKQQIPIGNLGIKPYHLRGAKQITNTDTSNDIKSIIDQAELNGEWAILTFHRLVPNGTSPGSLEMTVSDFAKSIEYLSERLRLGNLICAPIGQTYNDLFGI